MPFNTFTQSGRAPLFPASADESEADERTAPNAGRQLLDLMERTTGACIWVFELGLSRMHWSARLSKLLELLPDEIESSPARSHPLHFFAPDSRAQMAAAFEACIRQARPFDLEAHIVTARGRLIAVRVSGEALGDLSGSVVRVQGVIQDLTEKKRAEQESLSITMRLSTTLASIKEAFVTLDSNGCLNYVNGEAEQLMQRTASSLLGHELWRVLDEHNNSHLGREMRAVLAGGQNTELEEFFPALGKWLELRAYPFEDGVALYLRDVSAARAAQEQMLLLQTSVAHLNDIVLITEAPTHASADQRIVFVNDAFERQTGYSRQEVLGRTPRLLQGKRTQRSELSRIRLALQLTQPVRAQLINYRKNGEAFWIEVDIVPVEYSGRGPTHWVSVARDITERKAAVDEIEHLAFYDVLTRLPNRQLLMTQLERALSLTQTEAKTGALMFIDLDHFKVLNDTLGHAKGDLLLQQVATRLSACLRLSETVARLGGDEFVVMLEQPGSDLAATVDYAEKVAERILFAMAESYDLSGYQHHGTCSIGITCFNIGPGAPTQAVGDLLKQADLAMYQAKAAGRNGFCFFDPEMQDAATRNAELNTELRRGLRDGEFVLHYQPQVGHDGRMFGVEALLRWQHPVKGLLQPGSFVGEAEESGLILPLGKWVLETACAQLALWTARPETARLAIAVNVSVRQFRQPDFVDQLLETIRVHGVDARRLKLELTESLLATGMEVTVAKMKLLKQAGVTLSIDDFGMGYSALSYLKRLPLDQLKIDRTFVRDILFDPNDAAIARTIIGLAQSLGLSVIAEGVETEEQRAQLLRFGCECYQGYLFCKALPVDELERFIVKLAAQAM